MNLANHLIDRACSRQTGSRLSFQILERMRTLVLILFWVSYLSVAHADEFGHFAARSKGGRKYEFFLVNAENIVVRTGKDREREESASVQLSFYEDSGTAGPVRCLFETFHAYSTTKVRVRFSCPAGTKSPLAGSTYYGSHVRKGLHVLKCTTGCPPNPYDTLEWTRDQWEE
jgi:hypothetical protein